MTPNKENSELRQFEKKFGNSLSNEADDNALDFSIIENEIRLNIFNSNRFIEKANIECTLMFKLMWIACLIAISIIFGGVILLFFDLITEGIIAAISSSIPSAVALIFFKKDRELRKSREYHSNRIQQSQYILKSITLAETISDIKERDSIKKTIIENILGLCK